MQSVAFLRNATLSFVVTFAKFRLAILVNIAVSRFPAERAPPFATCTKRSHAILKRFGEFPKSFQYSSSLLKSTFLIISLYFNGLSDVILIRVSRRIAGNRSYRIEIDVLAFMG